MSYSLDPATDSCYEGTTCLINKLGIRDEKLLAETEAAYTLAKASYLDQHPIVGKFDLSHYCEVHRFLFCDLYDWAGELRTVNLSKKGTQFTPVDEIKQCAEACFARAVNTDYTELSRLERIKQLADFYNTLNLIHPFREGISPVRWMSAAAVYPSVAHPRCAERYFWSWASSYRMPQPTSQSTSSWTKAR